ncbi:MAG: methyltransferase domain-containing protein [Boseongicola sp.]|nr:MAG: methyltransferase domain-containing protein [Boseongicola sp.]
MTAASFWDKTAPKYALSRISDQAAYDTTMERVRAHLNSNDNVLEVGCGTGSTALIQAGGVHSYVGADISPGMLKIANEKLESTPVEGLSFKVSDVFASEMERETFDAVLGFNIYHLVKDLDVAFLRARDLIRPGGLFITKTPCLGKKWYLRPVVAAMQLVDKAPFVGFLTVEDYDAAVKKAGFEIIETGLYPPSAPSRFVVARKR